MRLDRALRDELVSHARDELPNECCGIIAGRDGRAVRVYRAVNGKPSPVYYEIDPQSMMDIYCDMDREGLELVGHYHSHPRGGPWPSTTDIKLAEYETPYLIVGLRSDPPEVLAWTIRDDEPELLDLDVTEWFYMSFVDTQRPQGDQWIGSCYLEGTSRHDALVSSHALGLNPGGQVMIAAIETEMLDKHVPYDRRYMLLTDRVEVEG